MSAREGLWLHVDGCIGALIAIAPQNAYRVTGIAKADSVALDPHKWLHAPFEAGCALVKDAAAHRNTFAVRPEYLETTPRGLAAAAWLNDYGLQTTRGFRALKIWMALKEHGVDKFGRLIDQNIAQGHYLGTLIEAEPLLEMVAPPTINIVCFRYHPPGTSGNGLKALNIEIMLRLQEQGIAAISDTTVHDDHCLRVAINNHRTRREDLELLVRETIRLGIQLRATARWRNFGSISFSVIIARKGGYDHEYRSLACVSRPRSIRGVVQGDIVRLIAAPARWAR